MNLSDEQCCQHEDAIFCHFCEELFDSDDKDLTKIADHNDLS